LEFDRAYEEDLSKWHLKATANLIYMFGMGGGADRWAEDEGQRIVPQPVYDAGKNVPQPSEVVVPQDKRNVRSGKDW